MEMLDIGIWLIIIAAAASITALFFMVRQMDGWFNRLRRLEERVRYLEENWINKGRNDEL